MAVDAGNQSLDTKKKLIQCLMARKRDLNIEVTEYGWPETRGIPLSDCLLKMEINGRKFEGRGTGRHFLDAVIKAAAEAVERAVLSFSIGSGTTNGMAVHTSRHEAMTNARLEFIERDAFFCHHLTGYPGRPIDPIPLLKSDYLPLFRNLETSGVAPHFFQLRAPDGYFVCLTALDGSRSAPAFGIEMGLACSPSPGESMEKSLLEAARNAISILSGTDRIRRLREAEFSDIDSPEILDHRALGHGTSLMNLSICGGYQESWLPSPDLLFSYEFPAMPAPLEGIPLVAAKAVSPEGQQAWFGHFNENLINYDRLSKFAGREVGEAEINKSPHIMA